MTAVSTVFSADFVANHRTILLGAEGGGVRVGCDHDPDEMTVQAVRAFLGGPVTVERVSPADVDRVLATSRVPEALSKRRDVDRVVDEPVAAEEIAELLDATLSSAVERGASDIHLLCGASAYTLVFRVQGVLIMIETLPVEVGASLVRFIKHLAKLRILERRVPQDGAIESSVCERTVGLRVSVVPTPHGETMVLRILDDRVRPTTLDALSFESDVRDDLRWASTLASGLVVVAGSTGSGKSTTAHAFVRELVASRRVVTIENPVEFAIDGATQIQTRDEWGLTFAVALRSALRQDPDVLMVGEVRDRETAQTLVESATTGHLVVVTVHARSTSGAVDRLVDLGVSRRLFETLPGVVLHQRLESIRCGCASRASCPRCRGTGVRARRAAGVSVRRSHLLVAGATFPRPNPDNGRVFRWKPETERSLTHV